MAAKYRQAEEGTMRVEINSYFPQHIKGEGWVYAIHLLPSIEFIGIVNTRLVIAWLFWEVEFQSKSYYE